MLPKIDQLMGTLQNAQGSESVRLHIPRTLQLIYDVRNKRDVAHLADGINPNMQDATLVVRNMERVVAELVRLFHDVSPTEAHAIIADLVSKDVPLIQVFDGFPRVLKQLKASDHFPSRCSTGAERMGQRWTNCVPGLVSRCAPRSDAP